MNIFFLLSIENLYLAYELGICYLIFGRIYFKLKC